MSAADATRGAVLGAADALELYAVDFAEPSLEAELQAAHPDCQQLARDFALWSRGEGLPNPCVTAVGRTRDDMERLYLSTYLSRGHSLEEAKRLARARFSWHLCRCGVDFRNRHYTPEQRKRASDWLRARCRRPEWELVLRTHGTGPHFHIGRRDRAWQRDLTPAV